MNTQLIVPTETAINTFRSLCLVAEPIIREFRNDLFIHDAQAIFTNPGSPFVHATYKNATHLYFLRPYQGCNIPVPYCFSLKTPLNIAKDVYEILRDTLTESRMGTPIYNAHFDGRQVMQIDHDACVEVCRNYYRDFEKDVCCHRRADS